MKYLNFKLGSNYILWSIIYVSFLVIVIIIFRMYGVIGIKEKTAIPFIGNTKPTPFFSKPPDILRAVYLTSTSGGNRNKIDWLIDLAGKSELNAVVIDIKDFSGYIGYDTDVEEAEKYGTEREDIKDIDLLIKILHENDIYAIARMTVFQDPALIRARPDWAVQNKYTGKPWQDRKGLSWIDPANRDAWKYLSLIALDAIGRGFDEINLDYIRFPSDGNLEVMVFPAWDREMTRPQVLNEFFRYMRTELGQARLSADLFGFVTTRKDDFGVGQVIEDAFEYFDYVSPMVYPSHYPNGFIGFANPAEHPYEVINYTIKSGQERLNKFYQETGNTRAKLRPWLQDFNLGANYTQAMVEAEIKATQDALGENYNGFMLWNARNLYHDNVFK